MKVNCQFAFIVLLVVESASAVDLFKIVTNASMLATTISNNYAKIETYSYKDVLAQKPTYIICIAVLTNSDEVHLQKRRWVVGDSGNVGPEFIPVAVQLSNTKTFKDIDISSGPKSECVFAALSTDNEIYIGNGKSAFLRIPSASRNQLEVITDGSTHYIFTMNASTWFLPGIMPYASLAISDSQDAILLDNGVVVGVGAASDSDPLLLTTSTRLNTTVLAQFGASSPTIIAWSDGSFLVCGQNFLYGIVCGNYPSVDGDVMTRNNTLLDTVSRPVLSVLDSTNNVASLTLQTYDLRIGFQYYEIHVVDKRGQSSFANSHYGVYHVHHTSQEGYIFIVYAQNTGIFMDMFYYGDAAPVLPPVAPFAPYSAPPVSDEPTVSPSEAPFASPIAVPPVLSPSAKNQSAAEVGADVLGPAISIPSAAAIGTAIFLVVYLRRKKQKEDRQQELNKMSVEGQSGTEGNYGLISGKSGSTLYAAVSEDADEQPGFVPNVVQPSEIDKRMQIPYKSLAFNREIGAGSYGKVFQGEWRGAQVAIKVNNQITDTEGFLGEAKLTLGIAPHPNLVQTFGISLDGPNPCIVLEFCGGGSLDSLMHKGAVLSAEKKREYALKIAFGLIHLHNNHIVHRDLAARNILLANDGSPKVSDFGMSRVIQDEEAKGKTKANVGPLRWMAPESLKDRSYSVKSDVWSYGILVWEIVAQKEPHEEEDQLMIAAQIRDFATTPPIPPEADPTLARLMEMCWRPDPDERPTMEQIVAYLKEN